MDELSKRRLDIDSWNRKPHYEFFRQFEEPYHSVCVSVDCSAGYRYAKSSGISVYLYQFYQSLAAAQLIEPFKQRMDADGVVVYERVDGASTVARENGTFGYGRFPFSERLEDFLEAAGREIALVRSATDLVPSTGANIIRYSALPWLGFTSLTHARLFSRPDSCPRISFGKMSEENGKRCMPVSIHVHHALVDGLHVGQYVECFQELLNAR